ncbi:unnamed protein product [Rotaria magnacalcarata]
MKLLDQSYDESFFKTSFVLQIEARKGCGCGCGVYDLLFLRTHTHTLEKSNHVNDIDISACREPGTSQTQEDVMHKDINLLLIREKSVGGYARQMLRSL